MTTYKDSIIKLAGQFVQQEIDDNRSDIILTIPMTDILDAQAKQSFLMGVQFWNDCLTEFSESKRPHKEIAQFLKGKLIEAGLEFVETNKPPEKPEEVNEPGKGK